MRRPILLLTLAILLPSVVLGWLAIRSLNNQQAASGLRELQLQQERARRMAAVFSAEIEQQRENFNRAVDQLASKNQPVGLGENFTSTLQEIWPPARIGFIVSPDKRLLAPLVRAGEDARSFRLQNEKFLTNREPLEVYRFSRKLVAAGSGQTINPSTQIENQRPFRGDPPESNDLAESEAPAQFEQLIGGAPDGAYSRFLDNELELFFWTRQLQHPDYIFGAQVDLAVAKKMLRIVPPAGAEGVCLAILDEKNLPVLQTVPGLNLRQATIFAEAPVGVLLPYWRAVVYLRDASRIDHAAKSTRWLVLGTVVLLVSAIAIGTCLIILSVQRELRMARQQTDFVSNVTHELKTPLTSIRMFAELLEGAEAADAGKRQRYLGVIHSEINRLTHMINNVLDFTRSGQAPARRERLDLREPVNDVLERLRPQLEADGFHLTLQAPAEPIDVLAERDAITQILQNLISNAEKYSGTQREIAVQLTSGRELLVLDRGIGVSSEEEKAIFEKFHRAKNAASLGAGGAGLGLTIARNLAVAQGGTLVHLPRAGGGSIFRLTLPEPA